MLGAISAGDFFQSFFEESAVKTTHFLCRPAFFFGAAHFPGQEPAIQTFAGHPGRAIGPDGGRTFFFEPAQVAAAEKVSVHLEKEEIKDAFDVGRDAPPALLVTFHGLERNAQELGHFPLRAPQPGPETGKFVVGHFSKQALADQQVWI